MPLIKQLYNRIAFLRGKLRSSFWRLFVKKMGREVYLLKNCTLLSPEGIEFGDFVWVNHHTSLSGQGGLKIGNFVMIGPNCNVLTSTHNFHEWTKPMSHQGVSNGAVEIGDDVWIGANAVILPNVKIGRGSVIGANAVVSTDVEPFSIVGGVPAKLIKYRFEGENLERAKAFDLKTFIPH
jgi:acetyltransferase-like isoleucine patch superfamily enzyme